VGSTVVIGVCTFRRNEQLATLIRTLASFSRGALADLDLALLVVDDDPEGGAASTVEATAPEFRGEVVYAHAGSANLSIARNTVISEGLRLGQWLVFVDDDCVPDEHWLHHLLDVQARTGADMVTGHVVYRVRPGAPRWLVDEPFATSAVYEDGAEPAYGNTANVLLSTAFLTRSGVRFRRELGLTGGEDMTFYADARKQGAVLRYAVKAIVYEELTRSRESLRYHLHRQFWLGNNMVVINRHTRREKMTRMFLRGGKLVLVSPLKPLLDVRRGRPAHLRWAAAHVLEGVGLMLGVLGVSVRHRA